MRVRVQGGDGGEGEKRRPRSLALSSRAAPPRAASTQHPSIPTPFNPHRAPPPPPTPPQHHARAHLEQQLRPPLRQGAQVLGGHVPQRDVRGAAHRRRRALAEDELGLLSMRVVGVFLLRVSGWFGSEGRSCCWGWLDARVVTGRAARRDAHKEAANGTLQTHTAHTKHAAPCCTQATPHAPHTRLKSVPGPASTDAALPSGAVVATSWTATTPCLTTRNASGGAPARCSSAPDCAVRTRMRRASSMTSDLSRDEKGG